MPVAIQILLQAFLGMADVSMVAGLGAEAVAAVGLSAKLHFLVMVFMIGVASAGAILTAQYSGANDMDRCRRTLALTLLVGAVLSTPFMLIFGLAVYWLDYVNPDQQVVKLAVSYLFITVPVVLITQIVVVYESCLRSIGSTVVPLIIGVITVLLNVLLNYILIFGHWGFPPMGVDGAALGTLIARLLQLVAFFAWLYLGCHVFALKLKAFICIFSWKEIRPFIVFSVPVVLNHGVWGLGNATYHIATGFAGTQALAVMGAIAPIESAFFSIFVGLASACSVLIGQSLGADDSKEAWRLHRFFDRFGLILVFTLSFTLWLMRPYLVSVLNALDEQTVDLLMNVLSVFCVIVLVKIMNLMRILGVLRAGGDNHFCLVVDSFVMWAVGLPIFIYGVYSGWSFLILFALMALEDVLKLLPVKFRINKGYWVKNLAHSY